MAPAPGPTAREILGALQPQLETMNDAIGELRTGQKELLSYAVRNQARLDEHERRLGGLEAKKPNGNGVKGEGRLTIKEVLLLGAGLAVLSGGTGAAIAELLKVVVK